VLPVRAQTLATLEGTTFDATRAVVPDTLIEVSGPTVSRTVISDDKGSYRLMSLPAGDYTVTATRSGFSRQVLQNVMLMLDRVVTLDITMTVEAREELIAVTATPLLIDRTDSSIRQVTDTRTIEAIPLNGRNYLDLIQLSPGVIVNTQTRSDWANGAPRRRFSETGNAGFLVLGLRCLARHQGCTFHRSWHADGLRW